MGKIELENTSITDGRICGPRQAVEAEVSSFYSKLSFNQLFK